MTPAPSIHRDNVAFLIHAVAPRISPWFRHVLALSMMNPQATPDTLFCLADALEEAAQATEAMSQSSILAEALYCFAIFEFRALAELCNALGRQMATAA